MPRRLIEFLRNTNAATAVEYGLILALIVVAIIASISVLGGSTGVMWGTITGKVANAMPVS